MLKRFRRNAEFSRSIKDDPIKRNIVLLKLLSQWTGFWPEDQPRCFTAFAVWTSFNLGLMIIGQIFVCYRNIKNVPIVIQTVSIMATLVQCFVKFLVLLTKKKKFRSIITTIWFEFLPITAAPISTRNKISQIAKYNRTGIFVMYLTSAIACIQFLTLKLITGERTYPLPLPLQSKTPQFEILYVWEFVCAVPIALTIFAVDIMFATLIMTCATQLNIIGSSLKLYGTENKPQKINFIKHFTDGSDGKKSLDTQLLIRFIQQHNLVVKTCQEIEQLFQQVMLVQLLSSAITICFSMFLITKFSEQLLQFIVIPISITVMLTCYCFFSNELIEAGCNCTDAAYNSAWYSSDVSLQKYLILIIQKANEELGMTAGGFTKMNRNLLVQFFKFGMSVYMLLGTLVEKRQL